MGSEKSLSPGGRGMVVTFVILAAATDLRADSHARKSVLTRTKFNPLPC